MSDTDDLTLHCPEKQFSWDAFADGKYHNFSLHTHYNSDGSANTTYWIDGEIVYFEEVLPPPIDMTLLKNINNWH